MTLFLRRIVRALKLDRQLYEEVESDQNAFGQALAVVALSSIATVAGLTGRFRFSELLSALALGILAWAGWSAIAFLVGAQIYPERKRGPIRMNSCEQRGLRRPLGYCPSLESFPCSRG